VKSLLILIKFLSFSKVGECVHLLFRFKNNNPLFQIYKLVMSFDRRSRELSRRLRNQSPSDNVNGALKPELWAVPRVRDIKLCGDAPIRSFLATGQALHGGQAELFNPNCTY